MNPSDDFVMEEKALKLLASLHELTSLNIDSQSQTTCNFCIRKVHSVINDTIPFEVACALLEDVEKIVTILCFIFSFLFSYQRRFTNASHLFHLPIGMIL